MMMNVLERPMTEYLFSLYGTSVRYATASLPLAQPVYELLRHFRRDSIGAAAPLTVCFQAVRDRSDIPLTISASARQLSSGTGEAVGDRRPTGLPYEVMQDGSRLIADFFDIGVLVIDNAQGRADGYLIKPDTLHENMIEYLFHLALIELLRRQGLYSIHATALEKYGCGVLIPGNSGRGKTTSFISLLRSGYRYLSDDHPLIRDAGTHVEMLPFPVKIGVTETTAAFFPELRNAPDHILHPGLPKRSFHAEDLYQTSVGDACQPAIMLLPHVADISHSWLEPLPKSRALEAILPQALLVYDSEISRRQFQTLARLVQQVDCYRLHFGRDVLELPKLITPILEKLAA